MTQTRTRRASVQWTELPGMLVASITGDAPRLRRIVGARRSGRFGLLLAVASGGLAFGPGLLPAALLAHLLLSGLGFALTRSAAGLGPRAYLRLSAWPVILPLVVAAAIAPVLGGRAGLAWAALLVGHALLWRGLRRGLR